MNNINDFEFGALAREIITGYTGIVCNKTIHLNGCHRIGLCPTSLKDGQPQKGLVADVQQVELVPGAPVIKPGSIGLDWGNVKLGVRVRDVITQFTGIVMSKTEWFGGKKRVGVMSQELHNGETIPIHEFDVTQIEVLDPKPLFGDIEASLDKKPGGPYPDPTP